MHNTTTDVGDSGPKGHTTTAAGGRGGWPEGQHNDRRRRSGRVARRATSTAEGRRSIDPVKTLHQIRPSTTTHLKFLVGTMFHKFPTVKRRGVFFLTLLKIKIYNKFQFFNLINIYYYQEKSYRL